MLGRGLTCRLARDQLAGASQRSIGADNGRRRGEAGFGGPFGQHGHEVADRAAGEPLVGVPSSVDSMRVMLPPWPTGSNTGYRPVTPRFTA